MLVTVNKGTSDEKDLNFFNIVYIQPNGSDKYLVRSLDGSQCSITKKDREALKVTARNGRPPEDNELTDLEEQLVAEAEKLIAGVRALPDKPHDLVAIADEVEDFITNHCEEN